MEKDHLQLWSQCQEIIRDNVTPEQFNGWFKPVTSLKYEEGALTLLVPSSYFMEHIEANYLKLLSSTLHRVYGPDVKLYYRYNQVSEMPSTKVTMGGNMPSPAIPAVAPPAANPFQPKVLDAIDSQLNPRYTFENYCASDCNKLARTIGETIGNNPNCKTYNPLFVFGSTGVGKTHLIQAIGIRIKERNPLARVLYVTARLFESQYTTAVRQNKTNDFFLFYQSIDCLIIDDIQDFMGNKPGTQNAFFHIFNHLHQNSKQLIMSSDVCPSMMEGLEERLLSRFKWGITVKLEAPDYALRKDVLNQKAQQDGLDLPDEVVDLIASNVTNSIREIEGVVSSILVHATVLNQDISLELARNVLANSVHIRRRTINFDMVAEQVCAYYGLEVDAIYSKTRKREISDARQMVMYIAKKHTKMPLTAIGTRLSRGHATILHGCKNIEERLSIDKTLREAVEAIEKSLM